MSGLFGRGQQESVEEYWAQVSDEIGSPVLAYGLGKYLSGRDDPGPLWGLLYHSASTFYFRHFAQQNWFSSLLTTTRSTGSSSGDRNREVLFEIPIAHIQTVEVAGPESLMERIFRPSPSVISLVSMFESAPPFRFTIENNRDTFLSSLRSAIGSKS